MNTSTPAIISLKPQDTRKVGDRRERHGDLELGIVAAARAFQRLGPAMVEHVFALRMALHIKRRGAVESPVVRLRHQILGLPAGAPAHGFRVFQSLQEAVAEERVSSRARGERAGIPLRGVDRCKRIDDAKADRGGVIRHEHSIARIVPARWPIGIADSIRQACVREPRRPPNG